MAWEAPWCVPYEVDLLRKVSCGFTEFRQPESSASSLHLHEEPEEPRSVSVSRKPTWSAGEIPVTSLTRWAFWILERDCRDNGSTSQRRNGRSRPSWNLDKTTIDSLNGPTGSKILFHRPAVAAASRLLYCSPCLPAVC